MWIADSGPIPVVFSSHPLCQRLEHALFVSRHRVEAGNGREVQDLGKPLDVEFRFRQARSKREPLKLVGEALITWRLPEVHRMLHRLIEGYELHATLEECLEDRSEGVTRDRGAVYEPDERRVGTEQGMRGVRVLVEHVNSGRHVQVAYLLLHV